MNVYRSSFFYWNWVGKFLEVMWPLGIIYWAKWFTPKEIGLIYPKHRSDWYLAFFLGIGLGGLGIFVNGLGFVDFPPLETILFQSSMPGIAEELVYRGVFWALLSSYFPHSRKKNVLILTTILFTVVHVVSFSPRSGEIVWNFESLIPVSIVGAILGWVREKTGSIWPCVIVHNLANSTYMISLIIFTAW